jgi:hypothetical protein
MYFGTAAVNKNTLAAVISEIHFVELGDQRRSKTVDKAATEIRILARTEVGAVWTHYQLWWLGPPLTP